MYEDQDGFISPFSRGQRERWERSHVNAINSYWPFRNHDLSTRTYLRREIAYAKYYRNYRFWYERLFDPILQLLMLK